MESAQATILSLGLNELGLLEDNEGLRGSVRDEERDEERDEGLVCCDGGLRLFCLHEQNSSFEELLNEIGSIY